MYPNLFHQSVSYCWTLRLFHSFTLLNNASVSNLVYNLCHHSLLFPSISFYNRDFGVQSLLIFKSFNRLLSCFQKGLTHVYGSESKWKEQFMPQASVSQAPCTVPSKHQLLCEWLWHWTSVFSFVKWASHLVFMSLILSVLQIGWLSTTSQWQCEG